MKQVCFGNQLEQMCVALYQERKKKRFWEINAAYHLKGSRWAGCSICYEHEKVEPVLIAERSLSIMPWYDSGDSGPLS